MTLGEISKIASRKDIFGDYPMIAGHRKTFEKKFIDYYYFHEINYLSYDQFRQRLNAHLRKLSDNYMQLYKSEHLIDSPLTTYDMVESTKRKSDANLFAKIVGASASTAKERGQESSVADSTTDFIENIIGHSDTIGNLGQQTTANEDKVSNEHTVQTDDTVKDSLETIHVKNDIEVDGTIDRAINVDSIENQVGNETHNLTENIVTDRDITTVETDHDVRDTKTTNSGADKELHTGTDVRNLNNTRPGNTSTTRNLEKDFADTPQQNFVTGNSIANPNPPPSSIPISMYATTVNIESENTNQTQDTGTTTTTDEHGHVITTQFGKIIDEHMVDDLTKNIHVDDTTSTDRTVSENTDNTRDTTGNVKTDDNTISKETTDQTTDTTDTIHETTHLDRDINTDYTHNIQNQGTKNEDTTQTVDETKDTTSNTTTHSTESSQDQRTSSAIDNTQSVTDKAQNVFDQESRAYKGRKMHNQSELLQAYRRTFINIDEMIIEACAPLFIGVVL